MTIAALMTALRACAAGFYPHVAGTGLLIAHGTFLHRSDFTSRYIQHGTSISDGITQMAAIDWDAAILALNAGELPCSGLLTELPDVSAAQVGRPSPRPIVGVSERSRSQGQGSYVASLIATETGHTVLNHLPSFSSLPILDVSCGGP